MLVHFLLGGFYNFFDSRGVNPSILNKFDKCKSGDFPSNIIESANHHNTRGVIDNYIDSGGFLKGPNVSSFAANNSAFYIVTWNIHGANGSFRSIFGSISLQGNCKNFFGRFFAAFLNGFLMFFKPFSNLPTQSSFQILN